MVNPFNLSESSDAFLRTSMLLSVDVVYIINENLIFAIMFYSQGGSSGKVVDCILCLKGYHEWKLAGGIGIWRYGGTVKITSSINVLPCSLLDSGNGDESPDKSNSLHGQQLLERLNLFTDIAHEESKAASALSFLFNKFGLQLLQSFLTQCNGTDDLPLSSTVGNTFLLILAV